MAVPLNLPQASSPFTSVEERSAVTTIDPTWYRLIVQIVARLGGSTGPLQVPAFAKSDLPVTVVIGAQAFVTNTARPAWFDGSTWRYADGSAV